jgi:hypothetical protein
MTDRHLVWAGILLQVLLGGIYVFITSSSQEKTVVLRKTRRSACQSQPPSCSPKEGSSSAVYDTYLLVLVFSEADQVKSRAVARETWISNVGSIDKGILVKFVVGANGVTNTSRHLIRYEIEEHRDVLLLNGIHKGLYGVNLKVAMKWARANVNFKYFMKVEDSVYVMLGKVVRSLEEAEKNSPGPMVWGRLRSNSKKYIYSKEYDRWSGIFHSFSFPVPENLGYAVSASIVHSVLIDENSTPMRTFIDEGITLGLWISMLNIDYLTWEVYEPGPSDPPCPKDMSKPVLYSYGNVAAGFRNIHSCLRLELLWLDKDHDQPVEMLQKL